MSTDYDIKKLRQLNDRNLKLLSDNINRDISNLLANIDYDLSVLRNSLSPTIPIPSYRLRDFNSYPSPFIYSNSQIISEPNFNYLDYFEGHIPIDKPCVTIQIQLADIIRWYFRLIYNHPHFKNGKRGPSSVKIDRIYRSFADRELMGIVFNEDDDVIINDEIDFSELESLPLEICKGPNFINHNLLKNGYLNTLSLLFPNLIKILKIKAGNVDLRDYLSSLNPRSLRNLIDDIFHLDQYFDFNNTEEIVVIKNAFAASFYKFINYIYLDARNSDYNSSNYYFDVCSELTNLLTNIPYSYLGQSSVFSLFGDDYEKLAASLLAMFCIYRQNFDDPSSTFSNIVNKSILDVRNQNPNAIILLSLVQKLDDVKYSAVIDVRLNVDDVDNNISLGEVLYIQGKTDLLRGEFINGAFQFNRKKAPLGLFGDYKYLYDTSCFKKKGWIDNSNSGNLCSLTCLLYNPKFSQKITKLGFDISELMAVCILKFNMFHDERSFRVSFEKMLKIHLFISEHTGYNFEVRYRNGDKNTKTSAGYLSHIQCYLHGKKRDKSKDLYTVFMLEGHAFTVCDDAHLKYLHDQFLCCPLYNHKTKSFELKDAKNKVARIHNKDESIIDYIRIKLFINDYLTNKSNLYNLIDDHSCVKPVDNYIFVDEKMLTSIDFAHDNLKNNINSILDAKSKKKDLDVCLNKTEYPDFIYSTILELFDNFDCCNDLEKRLLSYCKYLDSIVAICLHDKSETIYCGYDIETYKNTNKEAECYGLAMSFFNDENIIDSYVYHNLDNDLKSDQLFYNLISTCISRLKDLKKHKMTVFAHNGGKFDTFILLSSICKLSSLLNDKYTVDVENLISSGGRIKLMLLKLKYKDPFNDAFDEEYILSFVDSYVLLECKLSKVPDEYGLDLTEKLAYPYKFYDYLISSSKNKMIWSFQEIIDFISTYTNGKNQMIIELVNFINTVKLDKYDFVDIFKDYCLNDVAIMCNGLINANRVYSNIDLSRGNEVNILDNLARGFLLVHQYKVTENKEGNKVVRSKPPRVEIPRLLDSITISSFANKMLKFYVYPHAKNGFNGIDAEYMKVSTGGLTYNQKVQKIESSIINDIVGNKYFYIDNVNCKCECFCHGLNPKCRINSEIINYLSKHHGYDCNKLKLTYDATNPPIEIIQLKDRLINLKNSSIILLDANSLYPSAISLMKNFGGFPVGIPIKFDNNTFYFDSILNSDSTRWIGYFKIHWKPNYLNFRGMHPLIIKTKNGNRHLLPCDKENSCMGMTDIMYKSIKNSGLDLYDLEFINGIYWNSNSSSFSHLSEHLYSQRVAFKKEGKKTLAEAMKKILNSWYGVNLKKCYFNSVKYLSTFNPSRTIHGFKSGFEHINSELDLGLDTSKLDDLPEESEIPIESSYDTLINKVDNVNSAPVHNYMKCELLDNKAIDNYTSFIHYASFILDASKYITNELFKKLDWKVYYSDTDSAYLSNSDFNVILDNNRDLVGSQLGQFKTDFDDKFLKSCIDNNIAVNKNNLSLVPDYGVVSILGIFNAKKQYCNILLGNAGTDDARYLTSTFQTTAKGLLHQELTIDDYDIVYGGKSIIQSRDILFKKSGTSLTMDEKLIRTMNNQYHKYNDKKFTDDLKEKITHTYINGENIYDSAYYKNCNVKYLKELMVSYYNDVHLFI